MRFLASVLKRLRSLLMRILVLKHLDALRLKIFLLLLLSTAKATTFMKAAELHISRKRKNKHNPGLILMSPGVF